MERDRLLFLLVLIFILGAFVFAEHGESYEVRYENVTRVIDGDTFVVEGNETVRPKGFDTTETGEECSEEAMEWVEERIDGEEVKMKVTGEDIYGRTLAHVYHEGEHLGNQLVGEGLAYTYYLDEDGMFVDDLIEKERKAMEDNRGCLWSRDLGNPEEVIDACDADGHVSEVSVVEGVVEDVSRAENITFLNFGEEHPDHCFTGVVWDSYRPRFPEDWKTYENKTVRIEGLVTEYDEKPQVELRDSLQIKVLEP
ncbi:MAG: thermonuclease family protein [Candidatus Aenigmatarchaeota archaeon]